MHTSDSHPPRPPARLILDDLEWPMPQHNLSMAPRRLRVWMFPNGARIAVVTERGVGMSVAEVAGLVSAALHQQWPDDPDKLRIFEHHPPTSDSGEQFRELLVDRAGVAAFRAVGVEQMLAWCGDGILDDMPELPPDPEFTEPAAVAGCDGALLDGSGIADDTVICGYPSSSGGALVVLETSDGQPLGPLPHYVKESPDGYGWGYIGSGPTDLARSILIAVLGVNARCQACEGSGRVASLQDDPQVEVDRNPDDLVRCPRCSDGISIPWAMRFRREYVAQWEIDKLWRITGAEIRSWLADLDSRPQL